MSRNESVRKFWARLVVSAVLLAGFGGMAGCKTVVEDPHRGHPEYHHDDYHHDHY